MQEEMDKMIVNQVITESKTYTLPFMRTVFGFLYQLKTVIEDIDEFQWIKNKSSKRIEGKINFRFKDGTIFSFIKYDTDYITFAFNSKLYDNPLAKLITPDESKYVFVHFSESRYKRNQNMIDEFMQNLFPVYDKNEFNKLLAKYGISGSVSKKTKLSKTNFYDIVGNNKFEIIFTKATGEKRKAVGTVNFEMVPEKDRPKSDDNKKNLEDTIIYYDLEKEAWRMFKTDMLDWNSIKVTKEVVDKTKIPEDLKKRITSKDKQDTIFSMYVLFKAIRQPFYFFTYGILNKIKPVGYKVSNNMTIGKDRISFDILKEIKSDGIETKSDKKTLDFDVNTTKIEIDENLPTIFMTTKDGNRYIFNRGNLFYRGYKINYEQFSDVWEIDNVLAYKINRFIENKNNIKFMKVSTYKIAHRVNGKKIEVISKGGKIYIQIPIIESVNNKGYVVNSKPIMILIDVKSINASTMENGFIENTSYKYEFAGKFNSLTFGE
jgi:hypothetical protein